MRKNICVIAKMQENGTVLPLSVIWENDKIFQIHIKINPEGETQINYELWNDVIKDESKLFPTKEELLKSL